jgi:peptidoglycan/LPS O-acetylase OafA/YrhL
MNVDGGFAGRRIPALDGIRGLAIGLVLWWHFVVSPLRANLQSLHNHAGLLRLAEFGRFTWSGVDLFFVLSGFLIGGILLDESQSRRYYRTFYLRRAYRILPLYAFVLVLTVILIPVYGHLRWTAYAVELPFYLLFLQNFRMAAVQSFGPLGLGATWSLAVEEQFYLTLPFAVRHIGRRNLWRVLLSVVVLAPLLRIVAMRLLKMQWITAYVLMPCRADALGLGVLTAIAVRSPSLWSSIVAHRMHLYVAFAMVAALGLWVLAGPVQPFTMDLWGLEYTLFGVLYSLLLMCTLVSPLLSSIFSFAPLRAMGITAYGLYLFQSVVGFVLDRILQHFSLTTAGMFTLARASRWRRSVGSFLRNRWSDAGTAIGTDAV